MKNLTFVLLATVLASALPSPAQERKPLPVYPGARLVMDQPEAGEQPRCCSFATRDSLSAVVAFYEKAFQQKAMDSRTYEKTYPAVKQLAEAAQRAMPGDAAPAPPPGAQARHFVLAVEQVPGLGKMPTETFTVASFKGETFFDIDEDRLGPGGEKYAAEFRRKFGIKSEGERAADAWKETHAPARQDRYNLPVYPGAVLSYEQNRGTSCYQAVLLTGDPFEKVVAFYRERLKGKLPESDVNGREGYENMFSFIDYRYGIAEPGEHDLPGTRTRILGKRGSVNRYVEILKDAPEDYVAVDAKSGAVRWSPAVQVTLIHTVLDDACAKIPKGAVWKESEKVDPKAFSGAGIRED